MMDTEPSDSRGKMEEHECEKRLEEKDKAIAELTRQLEEKARLLEQWKERFVYQQAEFENFRKYMEREREQIVSLAEERLVRDLLSTLDDFEGLMKNRRAGVDDGGIQLIYRNLLKVLGLHGLERIEAKGKRFDPFYHEAICRERSDCEEGTVLEELQTGYMLKKKVLRPAKVKIAERCTIMDSMTEEGE